MCGDDVFHVPADGAFAQGLATASLLALAPGAYDLVGAYGAGEHTIVATAPGVVATLAAPLTVNAGVTLRVVDLEVRGPNGGAFVVAAGGALVVERALIGPVAGTGIVAAAGSRLVVRLTRLAGNTSGALRVTTDDFVLETTSSCKTAGPRL